MPFGKLIDGISPSLTAYCEIIWNWIFIVGKFEANYSTRQDEEYGCNYMDNILVRQKNITRECITRYIILIAI